MTILCHIARTVTYDKFLGERKCIVFALIVILSALHAWVNFFIIFVSDSSLGSQFVLTFYFALVLQSLFTSIFFFLLNPQDHYNR